MRLLILICYNLIVIILIGCDNMNLDTNNHSVFLLYFHLVLVVKYRRLVFDAHPNTELSKFIKGKANEQGV